MTRFWRRKIARGLRDSAAGRVRPLSIRRMTEEERLHGPDPIPMRWCPICRTHNADPCETGEDMAHCALVPSATETPFVRNR